MVKDFPVRRFFETEEYISYEIFMPLPVDGSSLAKNDDSVKPEPIITAVYTLLSRTRRGTYVYEFVGVRLL